MANESTKWFLPNCSAERYVEVWKNRRSLLPAIEEICRLHGVGVSQLHLFETGSNVVVRVNPNLIVKLYFPFHRDQFESERAVLGAIQGRLPVAVPKIHFEGELENWPYLIFDFVAGKSLGELWKSLDHDNRLSIMDELGRLIRALHNIPILSLQTKLKMDWGTFLKNQFEGSLGRHKRTGLPEKFLADLPSFLPSALSELWNGNDLVLVSGDFTPEHILLDDSSGRWSIAGLIDFADCMIGQPEYDFTGPATFIVCGDSQLLSQLFLSYGYNKDSLTPSLSKKMMWLTLLHRFANFKQQIKIEGWEYKFTNLAHIQNHLWRFSPQSESEVSV